jgi:hypothetical protein
VVVDLHLDEIITAILAMASKRSASTITWPLPALTSLTGPISPLPHITSSLLVLRCRSRKLDSLEPLLRAIDDDAFNAVLPLHPQLTTSYFCITVFPRQSNKFGQVSGIREWGNVSDTYVLSVAVTGSTTDLTTSPKACLSMLQSTLTPNNLIAQHSGSRNRNYRNDEYNRDSPEAEP